MRVWPGFIGCTAPLPCVERFLPACRVWSHPQVLHVSAREWLPFHAVQSLQELHFEGLAGPGLIPLQVAVKHARCYPSLSRGVQRDADPAPRRGVWVAGEANGPVEKRFDSLVTGHRGAPSFRRVDSAMSLSIPPAGACASARPTRGYSARCGSGARDLGTALAVRRRCVTRTRGGQWHLCVTRSIRRVGRHANVHATQEGPCGHRGPRNPRLDSPLWMPAGLGLPPASRCDSGRLCQYPLCPGHRSFRVL